VIAYVGHSHPSGEQWYSYLDTLAPKESSYTTFQLHYSMTLWEQDGNYATALVSQLSGRVRFPFFGIPANTLWSREIRQDSGTRSNFWLVLRLPNSFKLEEYPTQGSHGLRITTEERGLYKVHTHWPEMPLAGVHPKGERPTNLPGNNNVASFQCHRLSTGLHRKEEGRTKLAAERYILKDYKGVVLERPCTSCPIEEIDKDALQSLGVSAKTPLFWLTFMTGKGLAWTVKGLLEGELDPDGMVQNPLLLSRQAWGLTPEVGQGSEPSVIHATAPGTPNSKVAATHPSKMNVLTWDDDDLEDYPEYYGGLYGGWGAMYKGGNQSNAPKTTSYWAAKKAVLSGNLSVEEPNDDEALPWEV